MWTHRPNEDRQAAATVVAGVPWLAAAGSRLPTAATHSPMAEPCHRAARRYTRQARAISARPRPARCAASLIWHAMLAIQGAPAAHATPRSPADRAATAP